MNLPLFIFVDELDRCRPSYAIEVLENIKHLFGVKGVFFVVATASEQLGHSIKSVYGNDFDSRGYLKRFFNQTYTLQEPDRLLYAEHLFTEYGLIKRENLFSPLDNRYCSTSSPIVEAFGLISNVFKCGLRDMEQYCLIIDSISLTFDTERIHIIYLVFLIILKDLHYDSYKDIISGKLVNISELINIDREVLKKTILTSDSFAGADKVVLKEIISLYIRCSNKNLEEISNIGPETNGIKYRILNVLINDMPTVLTQNHPPKHFLSRYPSLIEQAGKIT